jgi:hypothetical protein
MQAREKTREIRTVQKSRTTEKAHAKVTDWRIPLYGVHAMALTHNRALCCFVLLALLVPIHGFTLFPWLVLLPACELTLARARLAACRRMSFSPAFVSALRAAGVHAAPPW